MDKSNLLSRIREAGVIGAGGAGFPTYKKLEAQVEYIIANGAECEPLLYKDRESILREIELLFRGLEIMRELTGADKTIIALKEKNRDIAQKYKTEAVKLNIEFFIYKDVYPAGDEYVLIYEIAGRRVPPGGLPFQIGCIVDNTETIINIAKAADDIPVTDKYVTITGAVKNPITVLAPVGISYQECIDLAGGVLVDNPALILGGVMMGKVDFDFTKPLSKTIGGIIVLPTDHYLIKKYTTAREAYTRIGHGQCDQCSQCTELCPRYILGYPVEPHKVMRNLLLTGQAKQHYSMWAQYCVECNVCSMIACPEDLDPKNICADAKGYLREQGLSRSEKELDMLFRDVHPMRKAREVPINTVYRRLGINEYDRPAYFNNVQALPSKVIIPLDTHIGKNARAIVKTGDSVKKGQLIADVPMEALGCPAHASIDGTVEKIDHLGIYIKQR